MDLIAALIGGGLMLIGFAAGVTSILLPLALGIIG